MLDMYKGMVNSPETTITNDINAEDTIIYVLDETKVPEELPNLMTLGTGTSAETIKVLEVNGNALTVERGFQGVPRSWNAGTVIARNFTEYDYNALVENIKTLKGNTDINADDILSLMSYVGNLENLDTVEKSNIVLALNEIYQDLVAHKAENVQQFDEIYNRLNGLKSNDIQARREILDIKLKLDEMKVVDYLNKTGIGFYDLFENTEYIDITNTTATVDTASADVIFTGQESLKMLPQKFDASINNIELAIYDIDRESYQVDNSVSNSNQIQITVQSGKINIGEKYYYNGEVYEVTGVSET